MVGREGKLVSTELKLGYTGETVLADLAGKFVLPEGVEEKGNDIVIHGSTGENIVLRLKQ